MKEEKKKSWLKRHWLLTTLIIVVVIIISAFINNGSNPNQNSSSSSSLSTAPSNSLNVAPSSTYTASDVEKMSVTKKIDLCTKDIAGDSIDIPQVKDEAHASCYQIYYSGGEEALNEYVQGLNKTS